MMKVAPRRRAGPVTAAHVVRPVFPGTIALAGIPAIELSCTNVRTVTPPWWRVLQRWPLASADNLAFVVLKVCFFLANCGLSFFAFFGALPPSLVRRTAASRFIGPHCRHRSAGSTRLAIHARTRLIPSVMRDETISIGHK